MFYCYKEKAFINIFNFFFSKVMYSHGSHRWFINRINREDVFKYRATESNSLVLGSRTWISVSPLTTSEVQASCLCEPS